MSNGQRKFLPKGFEPGCHDVLIGRGKLCYNHIGNKNFHAVVASNLQVYSTGTKVEKSKILASIVLEIKKRSQNGGFFKKDSKSGLWFVAEEYLAREKVSQVFRDILHKSYRSSNSSRKETRKLTKGTNKLSKEVTSTPQQMLIQPTPLFLKNSMTILEYINISQQQQCTKTFNDGVNKVHSSIYNNVDLRDFQIDNGDYNVDLFPTENKKDTYNLLSSTSFTLEDEKDIFEEYTRDTNSLSEDDIFEDESFKSFYDTELADFYINKAQSFFDDHKALDYKSVTKEPTSYLSQKGGLNWTPTCRSSTARTA